MSGIDNTIADASGSYPLPETLPESGEGVIDSPAERALIRNRQRERGAQSGHAGIEADNVTVVYRNGNLGLENASFKIPEASICALVGINGSGKSTLFKALMGFERLSRGTVSILGQPAGKSLAKNRVAYVPQNEEVDWNFPVLVEDVVMMGRYGHMGFFRHPSRSDHEKVDQALQKVDMQNYRKRQIGELSGGQKKRVFLARALAQEACAILLDEPFTGVDVKSEDAIIDLLRELRATGHVILVSTHNLGSVPQFCDQVILINRTILDFGETESVFTRDNLQRAFGGSLRLHVLGGSELHEDDDARRVTVITDDERPVVLYDEDLKSGNIQSSGNESHSGGGNSP